MEMMMKDKDIYGLVEMGGQKWNDGQMKMKNGYCRHGCMHMNEWMELIIGQVLYEGVDEQRYESQRY